MNRINTGAKRRSALVSAMAAFIGLVGVVGPGVHAATLPPPPVSPAPVTDYEYDANGNPTKAIKAKGVSGFGFATTNAYDPLDRLKTNTDARNGVTQLGYDGIDQLKQVTDPRNLVTAYQRNGLGDLTQLTSPDTGPANITYDATGKVLTRTDSRGVLATLGYDDLDRLTSAVYTKSGQAPVSYAWTYDETGTGFSNGIGRLTTATFPGGSTRYAYDSLGRLTTVTQTVGTWVSATRYGYDAVGHVTSLTYPSGRVLTIQYNGGLPVSMSLAPNASSPAQPLISDIQWEPFGPVRSWQMQMTNGTKLQERVRDQFGRLVRYPLGAVVRDITYDAADRIVSYTHLDAVTGQATAAAQAMNQSFGYDELGRLTSIVTPSNTWAIGYDANGNRTSMAINGASRGYTTAATSNRLTSVSNPARGFGYDAAGNTLSDTGLGYTATYGLNNRLETLTKGTLTTSYQYDASGQRLRKEHSLGLRNFAYDQEGHLLGEYNATGPVQEFVWLGETPVAVLLGSVASTLPLLVYPDHLNAPRVLIDKNDALRWRWISEPFGTGQPEQAPSGLSVVTFNLRFPGQFFDSESGLNYNYFRDYDGTTGRYVQSDPIGLGGGINTYAYVGGNSVQYIDPSGLEVLVCSRKARGMPGNHAYLWDTTTSTAAGRRAVFGMSIIPGRGDDEAGPSGDACRVVEGSEGKEAKVMADMKTWGNWGLWTPYVDDCQNAIDRVLSANDLHSPGVPGGRFDEILPTPRPTILPPSPAANAPRR
ncbi:RHS repeat domain-containing protein [Mitsuaria sp. 7]|uniref:RHS repeat domain-containing protein n=1 Tax=Mitsuaria sp. 7 TaxID=1658665 RepID=UPI00082B2820|nr:RHS repeat-associated core domain-containing protein [Mitsuaria sp. 7]